MARDAWLVTHGIWHKAAWIIAPGGMVHDGWHMAYGIWRKEQGARQHGAWSMTVKWPAGWMVCKGVERYKSKKATVELGGPRKDSGFF